MEKIRCKSCGRILAFVHEPLNGSGKITIMCNGKGKDGKKCKTINEINAKKQNV